MNSIIMKTDSEDEYRSQPEEEIKKKRQFLTRTKLAKFLIKLYSKVKVCLSQFIVQIASSLIVEFSNLPTN